MKSKSFWLIIACGLCINPIIFSQEEHPMQPQQLSYHAELPLEHSYEVVKNLSNQAIREEILLKINAYRRADDDYLWVVNEELEILIRKF